MHRAALALIVFAVGPAAVAATQRVSLGWDGPATFAGATLRLVAVDDQRCPQDVQCISAGHLKVVLSLEKGEQRERLALGSGPGAQGPQARALGLTVQLCGMAPRPRTDRPTPRSAVRVDLVLSDEAAAQAPAAADCMPASPSPPQPVR